MALFAVVAGGLGRLLAAHCSHALLDLGNALLVAVAQCHLAAG